MTPYEIKLLLDIYSMPDCLSGRNEPILAETLSAFYINGLIDGLHGKPLITKKGRAHVIQLCNLLYPIETNRFLDGYGSVIPDKI